jgi:hypothetical protein
MFIIADSRLPYPILDALASIGDLLRFPSQPSAYQAICGHPDVFLCQMDNSLVADPSIQFGPCFSKAMEQIEFVKGSHTCGAKYPETAHYNAVITKEVIIHNLRLTDDSVLAHLGNRMQIHVNQGYARCNTIPLPNNCFITSDQGIQSAIAKAGFKSLYVDPKPIQINGFAHGFIGGCAGIYQNTLYLTGSLIHHHQSADIKAFIKESGANLVELSQGPLLDCGSIFFI